MEQSIIPAENSEGRTADWTDEDILTEPKPIVLTGQEAIDFADMVLSRPAKLSPIMERAAALHRKMVISE